MATMKAILAQLQNELENKKKSIAAQEEKLKNSRQEFLQLEETIQKIASLGSSPSGSEALDAVTVSVPEKKEERKEAKKYYVIFNGMSAGIYDEWSKASIHVTGKKGIIFKSYATMDEAKKAQLQYQAQQKKPINFRPTMAEVVTTPEKPKPKMTILSPYLAQAQQQLKSPEITVKVFNDNMHILTCYQDKHKILNIYPTQSPYTSPKAIILPETSPLLTYELFRTGLADTIYSKKVAEQFRFFPQKFQKAIRDYQRIVCKENPIFLKIYSTYPIFNIRGGEDVMSYSVVKIGVADMTKLPAMNAEQITLTQELEEHWFINNYWTLLNTLQRDIKYIRINYKSNQTLLFSRYKQELDEKAGKVIEEFELPLLLVEPNYSPQLKEKICFKISGIGGHACEYCFPPLESDDISEEGELSPIIEKESSADSPM